MEKCYITYVIFTIYAMECPSCTSYSLHTCQGKGTFLYCPELKTFMVTLIHKHVGGFQPASRCLGDICTSRLLFRHPCWGSQHFHQALKPPDYALSLMGFDRIWEARTPTSAADICSLQPQTLVQCKPAVLACSFPVSPNVLRGWCTSCMPEFVLPLS